MQFANLQSLKELDGFVRANPDMVIDKLLSSDETAWCKVRDLVIVPYLQNSRFGQMALDRNIDDDEIFTSVYVQMVHNGQLSRLRAKDRLVDYIKEYARKYIRGHYQIFRKKITECMLDDDGWKNLDSELKDDSSRGCRNVELQERMADIIGRLWRTNPKYAYVLVLKSKNLLSSREVKDIFGISSEQNVNKVYERAKSSVRKELGRHG